MLAPRLMQVSRMARASASARNNIMLIRLILVTTKSTSKKKNTTNGNSSPCLVFHTVWLVFCKPSILAFDLHVSFLASLQVFVALLPWATSFPPSSWTSASHPKRPVPGSWGGCSQDMGVSPNTRGAFFVFVHFFFLGGRGSYHKDLRFREGGGWCAE